MKIIDHCRVPSHRFLRQEQALLIALMCLSILLLPRSMFADTVNGFVTRIDSQTKMELGATHVVTTPKTTCSFQEVSEHNRSDPATAVSQCDLTRMRIGSRVKITGQFTKGGRFIASHCEILKGYDPSESRLLLMYRRPAPGVLIRETLNEEGPTLTRSTPGWNGMWWLDGYPMAINGQTKLLSSPDSEMLVANGHLIVNAPPSMQNITNRMSTS